MQKMKFELEKFQVAHLANLIQFTCDIPADIVKGDVVEFEAYRFQTVNQRKHAKVAIPQLRGYIKDLLDLEKDNQEQVKEFKEPYLKIVEEFRAKESEEGVTEEQKKEYADELKKVEAEAAEKFTEQFKDYNDKFQEVAKQKVTIEMDEQRLDVIKKLFNENGVKSFPLNKGEKLTFGDDFLVAVSDALEAASKAE